MQNMQKKWMGMISANKAGSGVDPDDMVENIPNMDIGRMAI